MDIQNCNYAGKLTKLHGISGCLIIRNTSPLPDELEETESLFIEIDKQLVPFFISYYELVDPQTAIIQFVYYDSIDKAQELRNKFVYYLSDKQTPSIEQYHDLIGYTVYDQQQGQIGTIKAIEDNPNNPLFIVSGGEKEYYIPVNPEWTIEVNPEQKLIGFDLPEGLLDL